MSSKQRLVIIGNGMAGARLVEEVLARGGKERYEIVVFGEEPYGNYNRILLSSVLAGSHDPQDIFINPLTWYHENGVLLLAGNRIDTIDCANKLVYASDGTVMPYDKLVLATGSTPAIPPLSNLYQDNGALKTGAFVFRTLDDCDAMIKYAAQAHVRKAAIIGGGLLGLEAARGMLNRDLETHVVHLMKHVMEVQLDPKAGKVLLSSLERMGVRVHLEKMTKAVLGEESVTGLAFDGGSTLDCDMVIISIGIRPNVDLARRAGLVVGRGIVVQDDFSCSEPDVYAIGECSQHRNRVYGLVAPIWDQVQCLADRLTIEQSQTTYQGSLESTKLKVMGVELAVMGEKEPVHEDDEVITFSDPSRGVYKKMIVRDNRLAGAILLGDAPTAPRMLQMFERRSVLPENRVELLFPLSNENKEL